MRPSLLDVNVLIALLTRSVRESPAARAWLLRIREAGGAVLIPEEVAASYVRLRTNPRVFKDSLRAGVARDALAEFLGEPGVRLVQGSPHCVTDALDLCAAMDLRGDDVPDCLLAALAREHGATLVTFDRGFRRFADLHLELLSA